MEPGTLPAFAPIWPAGLWFVPFLLFSLLCCCVYLQPFAPYWPSGMSFVLLLLFRLAWLLKGHLSHLLLGPLFWRPLLPVSIFCCFCRASARGVCLFLAFGLELALPGLGCLALVCYCTYLCFFARHMRRPAFQASHPPSSPRVMGHLGPCLLVFLTLLLALLLLA